MMKLKNRKFPQILLVNLVLLYGAIFLGWDAFTLILFYVVETIIVGLVHVIKMLILFFNNRHKPEAINLEREKSDMVGLFLIPFFIVHFGFFIFVQMMVFNGFSNQNFWGSLMDLLTGKYQIIIAIIFLTNLGYMAADFLWNPKMKVYLPEDVFMEPYARIIIQQFMVILGGFVTLFTGNVLGYLIVLVVLKVVFEYYFANFNKETLEALSKKMEKKKNDK